jgi:hypothetical protein
MMKREARNYVTDGILKEVGLEGKVCECKAGWRFLMYYSEATLTAERAFRF